MVKVLSETNSILGSYMARLRDVDSQKQRGVFRHNIRRVGQLMAIELSKELLYKEEEVQTPLGKAKVKVLASQPIIATILRAGLPMMEGFQDVFDEADAAFLGAFRKKHTGPNVEIEAGYLATPPLDGRVLILTDPMLATGKSLVTALELFQAHGIPALVLVAAVVAAPEGIAYLEKNAPMPIQIFTAALDEGLNDKSYIIPGLGDAGDLCYGVKR